MTNDKQRIIAEFDRCPIGGSTRRFAEEVAKEQSRLPAKGHT